MTTTMHFGPEWMRKPRSTQPNPPPSPPPTIHTTPSSGASTYSALVSPAPPPQIEKRDDSRPFRYSKEEMLRIYKEGGGKGGLGLEVERWEGVVREVGSEPIGLREMSEAEKKLFAAPLNSDLRRRQSTDYLSPLNTSGIGDRPRLNHNNSGSVSPMRERFGLVGRRRDSTDQPPLTLPRKLSLSGAQGLTRENGLPSPRTRGGLSPGFDGVLNSGESWMARRRASEGLKPAPRGESDHFGENKGSHIKEEDEECLTESEQKNPPANGAGSDPPTLDQSQQTSAGNSVPNSAIQSNTEGLSKLTLSDSSHPSDHSSSIPGGTDGPPPSTQNPTSIEWSYLDPQGQVQGPFRADLMQKWYDDGYFTPDLLMKRTHIDVEWVAVGELSHRAGKEQVFLSPASTVPPGLGQHTDSPIQTPVDQPSTVPYQPTPTRTLRSSTLDNYLGTGSNPSDSPSSSFGGRFSNESPDPSAFGGRMVNSTYPVIDTSAPPNNYSDQPSPFTPTRRATYGEAVVGPSPIARVPSFGAQARAGSIDGFGFNGTYPSQGPWPTVPIGHNGPGFDPTRNPTDAVSYGSPAFNNSREAFVDNGPANNSFGYGGIGQLGMHRPGLEDRMVGGAIGYNNGYINGFGNTSFPAQTQGPGQSFSQSPSLQYANPQQSQSTPLGGQYSISPLEAPTQPINHITTPTIPSQSSWDTPEPSTARRIKPFDPPHPTSSNTIVNHHPAAAPSQPSPWDRINHHPQPIPQPDEVSPWYTASQEVVDDSWREVPSSNSLTFNNLGMHNQQLDATSINDNNSNTTINERSTLPVEIITPTSALPSIKSRRKSTTQSVHPQSVNTKNLVPPPQVEKEPSPPSSAQPKSPWSTDDDVKKIKSSNVVLSLREIQEAEAKKIEARKTAEREKERATRAAATTTSEDLQPFTASWGLPTSQAGARSPVPPKETPVPAISSSPSASAQVWTNATKPAPVKKTMKEIQEEEEKRKKTTAKESMATAATKRLYADTTNKQVPSLVPVPTVAWTTVGPSGKSTAPPVRPTISSAASSPAIVSVPPVVSRVPNGTIPRQPATTVVKPTPARTEDFPVTPSHDFLKWLGESLKGLNNSVNLEDMTSMLLSFPLEPDPSTAEIISDLIYANSTTLDGRRFASEFVSRRKADATSRAKGGASTGAAKPVSIADVVKAQPKASQPEWGGFKVVNKKKKGGRS